MQIFWARLASFGQLGHISDPLIVSKFHDETHYPKGQENKIYTIVKGMETFYHRHKVPITSWSEVKCVLKQVILWKQRMHQRTETRVCKFSGPHQLPSNSFSSTIKPMLPKHKKIKVWIRFLSVERLARWPKNCQRLSVSTTSYFLSEFFQISYMDCFHKTLVKVWIWVLSDES